MIAVEKRLYLDEGAEFFAKYELTDLINEFLNSYDVKNIIRQVYDEQIEQINSFLEKAKKEEQENLRVFVKLHYFNEKKFVSESIEIFKLRIFENFCNLSPTIIKIMKKNNVFEDIFKGNLFLQDFREIISEIKSNNVIAFSRKIKMV